LVRSSSSHCATISGRSGTFFGITPSVWITAGASASRQFAQSCFELPAKRYRGVCRAAKALK
jgi:hypothetical protein